MALVENNRLSNSQASAFAEDGYLVLPPVIDDDEIARLRNAFQQLIDLGIGYQEWQEDGVLRHRHLIKDPHLMSTVIHGSPYIELGHEIARQLLDADVKFAGSYGFYKFPLKGVTVPWHQGAGFLPPGSPAELLTLWMPLHEATAENGCMRYIPKSHRLGVVPHNRPDRLYELVADLSFVDEALAVTVPMPPGAAVIQCGHVIHCSGPNLSANPRLAFILDFLHETWHAGHPHGRWTEMGRPATDG